MVDSAEVEGAGLVMAEEETIAVEAIAADTATVEAMVPTTIEEIEDEVARARAIPSRRVKTAGQS